MGNELSINIKVNSDGSATLQQVTGSLGGVRQEAGSTGTALTRFSADAQTAGDGVRRALEFAGITVGLGALAYKVKEFYGEVMDMGARTELLRGSAYAIGQYYQVSGQAIDYYVGKLKEGGITEQNAFYATTKFLAGGLNLELIPALAAAAKNLAPLAPEGKTVNEEFKGLVTTISSGMPRGLKEFGVQMGNILGDAGRSLKQLDNEMSMTGPERAKATLDYVLAYSEKVKYVGEETANAYARQQAKVKLEADRAKEALFDVFRPLGEAITGEKIQAWQDLYGVISRNKTELIAMSGAVGVYVGRITHAVGAVLVFAGTHRELFTTALELATIYKVVSWITPYIAGTTAAAIANANLAAAQTTAAATSALVATAQTGAGVSAAAATVPTITYASALGSVAGMATVATPAITGAGVAAAASGTAAAGAVAGWTPLAGILKTIIGLGPQALAIAFAYGAYKILSTPEKAGDMANIPEPARAAPEAWAAAGTPYSADDFPGYETPMAEQQKGYKIPLSDEERMAESLRAVKKMLADAKLNQPDGAGKGGGGGGGGAGSDAADRSLENFIQRMKGETAKASGDAMSALDEWKAKSLKDLSEIAAKGQDITKGREALEDAYWSKASKISEDHYHWLAKESGDAYIEINDQMQEHLKKTQGAVDTEKNLIDVAADVNAVKKRKIWEVDQKQQQDVMGLYKQSLDSLAAAIPVSTMQFAVRERSLAVEIAMGKAQMDQKILELARLDISRQRQGLEPLMTGELRDQLKAQQVLTDAVKKYNLEIEKTEKTGGLLGGMQASLMKRGLTKDLQDSEFGASLVSDIQGKVGSALGKGFVDSLTGKKTDVKAMLNDWGGWFFEAFAKRQVGKALDFISPSPPKEVTAAARFSMPQISPVEARINAQEIRNLALENRQFTSFGAEIRDFGQYVQKGDSFYEKFAGQINQAFPELGAASKGLQSTVSPVTGAAGSQTLAANQSSLSSAAQVGAAVGMGVAAIGMLTGSKELSMAGMAISLAATLIQTAAVMQMAKWWHAGGIVAHQGLIVAHSGLAADERPAILQVGEGVFKRDTMAAYARAGIGFDELNDERLPVLNRRRLAVATAPGGGEGGGSHDNRQVHFHVSIGDIHAYDMTPQEAEKFVERKLMPVIQKKMGNYAKNLMD